MEKSELESWVGKFLLDGYGGQFGAVRSVDAEEMSLLVAFPDSERRIYLEPRDDGEFVHPELVRARYRPASREEIIQASRKRSSRPR